MRVFLKKIGFLLLVCFGLGTAISTASLWVLGQSSFYKPSFLVNAVEESQFDYFIIGASTGLTTLNTKVIDSILGTKGINLAMDDTALSSQYLMLQHVLAEAKQIKYCILAPSVNSYKAENNILSDNDYRFLPFVSRHYVSDYYHTFKEKQSQLLGYSKYFPLLGVSYYNTEVFYPSVLSLLRPKQRNRFDDKGNYTYPNVEKEAKSIVNFKKRTMTISNIYVEKISALCKKNGIELICYMSPIKGVDIEVVNSDYKIINHSRLFDNTSYFYDAIHVNSKGRQIASQDFALKFKKVKEKSGRSPKR